METGIVSLLIIIAVVVLVPLAIIALWAVVAYNGLVGLRNLCKNAWSQIDVQLKRRHDLIPNLVETCKGYASHERQTLEAVIQARSAAVNAKGIPDQIKAEGELSSALSRLMVVVEQYPDLKASQNFMQVQEELASTENRIAFARQAYNDAVLSYNNKTQMIPSSIVAKFGGFKEMQMFEVTDAAQREAPQVKF